MPERWIRIEDMTMIVWSAWRL